MKLLAIALLLPLPLASAASPELVCELVWRDGQGGVEYVELFDASKAKVRRFELQLDTSSFCSRSDCSRRDTVHTLRLSKNEAEATIEIQHATQLSNSLSLKVGEEIISGYCRLN